MQNLKQTSSRSHPHQSTITPIDHHAMTHALRFLIPLLKEGNLDGAKHTWTSIFFDHENEPLCPGEWKFQITRQHAIAYYLPAITLGIEPVATQIQKIREELPLSWLEQRGFEFDRTRIFTGIQPHLSFDLLHLEND